MALLRACSFTNLIMLERSSVLWRCGTKSLCFCETRFIIYRMSTLHDHSQGCHIICVCVWVCVFLGTYKDAFKTSRKPRKPLHKGDSGGSLVTKLCPTLCDPMDCSPPGSSVRGILQTRILEWVAIWSSRGSSQPRDRTHISNQVSLILGRFFTAEPPDNPWFRVLMNIHLKRIL